MIREKKKCEKIDTKMTTRIRKKEMCKQEIKENTVNVKQFQTQIRGGTKNNGNK